MKKFEFKSAICTSVEQSKHLLKLGLKKETADMTIAKFGEYYCEFVGKAEINCDTVRINGEEIESRAIEHIPAWSLHRLMEIMYNGDIFGFVSLTTHDRNIDTIYDLVIANIEGLIKIDHFNQDYLEDKQ